MQTKREISSEMGKPASLLWTVLGIFTMNTDSFPSIPGLGSMKKDPSGSGLNSVPPKLMSPQHLRMWL